MADFDPYLKRREVVILGVEATPGTTATQQYSYRWLSKTLSPMPSFLENESGVGDDYRVNDSAIDVWHSEGSLEGKVTEDGIGYLMVPMFSKVTSTDNGDGTFTHHFERDMTVSPHTLSIWDVRPSTTRLYKHVVFDNLNLTVEAGESGSWLTSTAAVKGWKHEVVTAPTPAFVEETEYTSRNVKVFLADDLAGLSNPASQITPRQINLVLEQTKTVDHSLGEGDTPEFDQAPFEARGDMVIRYKTTDFEDDFFANKVHAMKISIENNGTKLEYTATKVRFTELTDSDGRDEIVTQSISFYCQSDVTAGGQAIVADLTNSIASYIPTP